MLICTIVSFFCFWDNYTANKAGEWHNDLEGHEVIRGTIAAHGTEGSPSIVQTWLFAVMGWVILIYFIYIKTRSDIIVEKIDQDEKSPSDYTLLVTNLTKNATELEVEQWIVSSMIS